MTSEPLTDIMDMVGSFKEKHKQLRESILAYFSEIRKHREIALSNHYKMLFEFVSEVDSPNIHVQVLAQVHKHMEMGLLGPPDYRIFLDYFRSIAASNSEKLYLKLAELTISMVDRLDKGALQYARDLIELVSVMRLSPQRIPQTANQCSQQLLKKLELFSQSDQGVVLLNLEILLKEVCVELVRSHADSQSEFLYDETLILILVEGVLCTEGSRLRNKEVLGSTYDFLNRKQQQVETISGSRRKCLEIMVKLGSYFEYPVGAFLETLVGFGKESQANLELCLRVIAKVFIKSGLSKDAYAQTKLLYEFIAETLNGLKLEGTHPLAVLCSNLSNYLVETMGQMLESVQSSSLERQEQLDETRILLASLYGNMRVVSKAKPTGALLMAWTELFHQMLKTALRYRIQTNLVIKLGKYSEDLFLDTVQKYDGYFAEEEYWAIYHIIFAKGYSDVYSNSDEKLEMRLCGLKKLIIDCLARGRNEEVDFALKTIRKFTMAHSQKIQQISRRLGEISTIVCDKGKPQSVKLLLEMIAENFRSRQNIEVWIHILKECDAESAEARIQIVDMLSEVVQSQGDNLNDSCWVTLIDLLGDISKNADQDCLHRVLMLVENVVQEYVGIFSGQVVTRLVECLADFPASKVNVRDKYKLCGFLWSIGEKHQTQVLGRIAQKLEQFCSDEVGEVAINGLCVYSSLCDYDGYERMAGRILGSGRQNVIISYLHNYVKIVKRSLTQELYYRVNEFIVNRLPELYELGLNEIIIESTNCHLQLTKLTYREIFKDPDYFRLGLYFFAGLLSEPPKEIRLVRYSIPRMMLTLLVELEFLSSCQEFSDSLILNDCFSLLEKILEYPSLTNETFNLEKNKIYFEQDEFRKGVENIYKNLRSRQHLMTHLLTIAPISRALMVAHSAFIVGSRLAWLKLLGPPRDQPQSRLYQQYFTNPEDLEFVAESDWHFKHYLAVNGALSAELFNGVVTAITQATAFEPWHLWLVTENAEDPAKSIASKAQVLTHILKLAVRWFSSPTVPPQVKVVIIQRLLDLRISPLCLSITFKDFPWTTSTLLETGKFHLIYLSNLLCQIGLASQHEPLQAVISKLTAEVGCVLSLPQLPS